MNGKVATLQSISPVQQMQNQLPVAKPSTEEDSFATVLKAALNQVSNAEHASNLKTEALAQGNIDDLHDVMITAQKASITVEAAVQVQQKVIDIYNEMMRMQV